MFRRIFRRTADDRRQNGERGQALVEFALVLGIFLILMMGVIDFGLMLSSRVALTNASREGARLGAVQASTADIQAKVTSVYDATDFCALAGPATVTNAQGAPGGSVTVKVDCTYNLITPLGGLLSMFGGGIPDTFDLSSTSIMRLE